jgi:hypothetical protein
MVLWFPGGHCVIVEKNIAKRFIILPRDPGDLSIFSVRWSGRSSNQEFYENVSRVRRKKVLADLYWLMEHNVLYQESTVVVDPSNLDCICDDDECTLPITCTINSLYWFPC